MSDPEGYETEDLSVLSRPNADVRTCERRRRTMPRPASAGGEGVTRTVGRAVARTVALAVACLAGVSACGTGPGGPEAAAAAQTFAQQVTAAPEEACDLLSEQVRQDLEDRAKAPCAEALPELELPQASGQRTVDVYEQHARVVLEGDVMFLARFADGWRVTAAGCEGPGGDEPYDCELGG